jgi:Tfp pilus assembly protein PilO
VKPKRFFFVLCGVCAVLAAGLGVGFYYEVQHIKAETIALSKKSADATISGEQLDQLNDLKKQFGQLQEVLTKLNIALPADKNQSVLILQIQQLAANAGMSLPSASFATSAGLPNATSQTVKSGDVLALPISFQLTGTYDQLQNFLKQLEQLGRYSNVSSLGISKTATATGGTSLTFSIVLNVYVKP